MKRSSRALLVILVLVALATALAAVGPRTAWAESATPDPASADGSASAADPAPPADPGLTLVASPVIIRFGGTVQVTGHLSVPNATLTLSRRVAGTTDFVVARTLTADANGSVSWSAIPARGVTWRLDYAGDETWAAASAQATVSVRPRISLTAGYRRPLFRGDRVTFHIAVFPAHPGATVDLQRRDGDSWVTFKNVTLDSSSRATSRWTVDQTMHVAVRVQMAADAEHLEASSLSSAMFANPPNAHRVPYAYPHYVVIVVHEYKLYYYEHGVMKRSFRVALGRPGFPTPIGLFKIWGKHRPGGGALGACIMYYYARGIGIHGTNQQYLLSHSIPRNYSHGCCRMYNSQALWLYARCPIGTPVHNLR